MVVDHLCLVLSGPEVLRLTVGRLAVPLFFVLAGHLAGRIGSRHLWVAAAGVALPIVVPWIDSPNVLLIWAAGCCALAICRWVRLPLVVLAVMALTCAANGFGVRVAGAYELVAMLGLMSVGALLDRSAFRWGGRLPQLLELPGRHPVLIYLGHLLVLQAALYGVAG